MGRKTSKSKNMDEIVYGYAFTEEEFLALKEALQRIFSEDVPGGEQELCYNEIPTKYNWYYLRLDLDLDARQISGLQCNSRVHDVTGVAPMVLPAMPNLQCMLNLVFWVETDLDKRAFLYLDSVLVSGEWGP